MSSQITEEQVREDLIVRHTVTLSDGRTAKVLFLPENSRFFFTTLLGIDAKNFASLNYLHSDRKNNNRSCYDIRRIDQAVIPALVDSFQQPIYDFFTYHSYRSYRVREICDYIETHLIITLEKSFKSLVLDGDIEHRGSGWYRRKWNIPKK